MYMEHTSFVPPSDSNVRIWRYIDLPKLVSLLTTKSLWFPAASQLDDPHEGAFGEFNVQQRAAVYPDTAAEDLEPVHRITRLAPRWTYVSCWHMNESESTAM